MNLASSCRNRLHFRASENVCSLSLHGFSHAATLRALSALANKPSHLTIEQCPTLQTPLLTRFPTVGFPFARFVAHPNVHRLLTTPQDSTTSRPSFLLPLTSISPKVCTLPKQRATNPSKETTNSSRALPLHTTTSSTSTTLQLPNNVKRSSTSSRLTLTKFKRRLPPSRP